MKSKADIRQHYRARRQSVASVSTSESVCKHLLEQLATILDSHSTIAVYLASEEEVDLGYALTQLRAAGHRLAAPRVARVGRMEFHLLDPDAVEVGAYGLSSPRQSCPVVPADALKMMLMPLVAFDESGNRLGMGGGYYDRYLAASAASRNIRRIGIAFDCQRAQALPTEPHDLRLDAIVTETGWQFLSDRLTN